MKWLTLLVFLLSSSVKAENKTPNREPKLLSDNIGPSPSPPLDPFIKFITKDIWRIHKITSQCVKMTDINLCIKAKSLYPNQVVIISLEWSF